MLQLLSRPSQLATSGTCPNVTSRRCIHERRNMSPKLTNHPLELRCRHRPQHWTRQTVCVTCLRPRRPQARRSAPSRRRWGSPTSTRRSCSTSRCGHRAQNLALTDTAVLDSGLQDMHTGQLTPPLPTKHLPPTYHPMCPMLPPMQSSSCDCLLAATPASRHKGKAACRCARANRRRPGLYDALADAVV